MPKSIIQELESIKLEEGFGMDCKAFERMAEHCRVGREVENIAKLRFGKIRGKKQ